MWLLSADRAELNHFTNHAAIEGGYAILSHTWGPSEQTYQDRRAIEEMCMRTGKNPRDFVSEKIRQSCILAEKHGYRWIWVDSCCIDKSSSSELSEAINSMFTWYADSEVCFAYLEDVPSDCDFEAPDSPFRKARWHTWGWTLQELIAPALVVFVSKEWKLLGTKTKFATLLEEITWIYYPVLMNTCSYSNICVAQRMKWASRRKTTRVEDEAYCLMGLFDVHMPTIYGEGRLAFQRLQEEIMIRSQDLSLLASNPYYGWVFRFDPSNTFIPVEELRDMTEYEETGLFAASPADFLADVYYSPLLDEESRLQPYPSWPQAGASQNNEVTDSEPVVGGATQQYELPRMTRTVYGIELRLPTIEVDGIIIVVLLCQDHHSHIGLLLHPVTSVFSNIIEYHARKMYRVGGALGAPDHPFYYRRIIEIGNDYYNIRFGGKPNPMKVTWRNICVDSNHTPTGSERSAKLHRLLKGIGGPDSEAPFRHPRWLMERFGALGLRGLYSNGQLRLVASENPKPGLPITVLEYHCDRLGEGIELILGMCQAHPPEAATRVERESENASMG